MDKLASFITLIAWVTGIGSTLLLLATAYAIIKFDVMKAAHEDDEFLKRIGARRRINWKKPLVILAVFIVSWAWVVAR